MWGKLFCMFGTSLGIPLTLSMIYTSAQILLRHVGDAIRILHSDYKFKHDKDIEKSINVSAIALRVPVLICMYLIGKKEVG